MSIAHLNMPGCINLDRHGRTLADCNKERCSLDGVVRLKGENEFRGGE